MTVHADGILRLWTTDDGRCLVSSQPELIPKASQYCLKSLGKPNQHNSLTGVVIVMVQGSPDALLVNVFKMTVLRRLTHGFDKGFLTCKAVDKRIIITSKHFYL